MTLFKCLFRFPTNTTSLTEKLLSSFATFIVLCLVILVSHFFLATQELPLVVAPMGASAVLLFAVPFGPLSQPWPFVGGHLISALIGISIAKLIPDIMLASALAVSLAVFAMYLLGCLHPPGGATALSTVIGGSAIHHLGYQYLITPVAVNLLVVLIAALIINNLLPHRYYPNTLKTYRDNKNKNIGDDKVQAALSVSREDIRYALREMDEFVDVSSDELTQIFNLSATHSRRKKMGEILVQDIMNNQVIKAQYHEDVENLWHLMAQHKIRSIPIVDKLNRIEGIVTIADFLNQVKLPTKDPLKVRLAQFLKRSQGSETNKLEYAGHIMQKSVVTVYPEQHILDLFAIFYEKGFHHIPVVDHQKHLLGIITPKNLLLALHADLQC